MANEFHLPDIGEGLMDAEIVTWSVGVGDPVAEGQPLCEVETAKAVVELTSPFSGVVLHLGGEVGETIEVGAVLAVIGAPDDDWPQRAGADQLGSAPVGAATNASMTAPPPATKAMPVVRRLAAELGVDLSAVQPSDPGGRISREDVLGAADARAGSPAVAGDERIRLSAMRRVIAQRMAASWGTIPHVTTFDDVDVTRLVASRRSPSAGGQVVSLDALLVAAVVEPLRRYPEFNATLDGDELVLHRRYDIGIAVDTEAGLVVPVLRAVHTLGLAAITAGIADLSGRAKSRSLTPEELTGATFTASNIGALGGGHGTPLIPPATTAIISFGRAVERPWVASGELTVATVMPVSLSFDHRVIDGGLGRRFVDAVAAELGDPESLARR